MGWLHRAPGLDSAVPMLCPSYSGVPTGGLAQALPTWGLRKVEPGQAGNGAAQMPRNREFLERRAEQWLPTCRWAYLDCVAHFPARSSGVGFSRRDRCRFCAQCTLGAPGETFWPPVRTRLESISGGFPPAGETRLRAGARPARSKSGRKTCRLNSPVVDGATTAPAGSSGIQSSRARRAGNSVDTLWSCNQ